MAGNMNSWLFKTNYISNLYACFDVVILINCIGPQLFYF